MSRACQLVAVLLLALACGCGRPPAVEHHNLELVSALRTAVSARSTTWLDGVDRAVDARFAEGQMSSDERGHFRQLIQLARQGEWEAADKACFDFELAQLNRRRAS